MAIKSSLLLIAFIIFLSCNHGAKRNSNELSNGFLTGDWANDKCGCHGLRNRELAIKLIDENALKNSSREKFLGVFNRPDTVKNSEDGQMLVYYFNSHCKDGKILSESDRCYANFYFKRNKLIFTDFICE